MNKSLIAVSMCVLLSACAANRDGVGIGFGSGPNASELAKARSEMEQSALSTSAKHVANAVLTRNSRGGLVLIGTVGPLRTYDGDDARKNYEKGYVNSARQWHPEHPEPYMTEADYTQQVAGWTSVETYSIPGVMSMRVPAQVPYSVVKEISFPSTFASLMIQKTGDLVAGLSNDDGWVFVTQVLCKDSTTEDGGKSYRVCAANYERGRFDAATGRELDTSLAPKENGTMIDTSTYKRLPPASTANR
ncbi:hypothetical protein [Paraburkholderia sp. HP33-1]|uniref:hypothetical protein n=1 Tax=Paraburkholderia sp. HP33-1 TaxID=2883243 RepID=UPI001F424386|nr:hypothetical protein [Paraburkholderia sp. HP33-1]